MVTVGGYGLLIAGTATVRYRPEWVIILKQRA